MRWLVLDCSSVVDVDYSAGLELTNLINYLHQHGAQSGLAHADDSLLATLHTYGVLDNVAPDQIFSTIEEVFDAGRPSRPTDPVPGDVVPPRPVHDPIDECTP